MKHMCHGMYHLDSAPYDSLPVRKDEELARLGLGSNSSKNEIGQQECALEHLESHSSVGLPHGVPKAVVRVYACATRAEQGFLGTSHNTRELQLRLPPRLKKAFADRSKLQGINVTTGRK